MLVILFLAAGIIGMICNTKRRDSIFLIIGLMLFIIGVLIQTNSSNEQKMIESRTLMEAVIDPNIYILQCEEENTAICVYKDDSDKGWTEEVLRENYQIIEEPVCTNPRMEIYKDKTIGLIKLSFSAKEEIKLYIPINGVENL